MTVCGRTNSILSDKLRMTAAVSAVILISALTAFASATPETAFGVLKKGDARDALRTMDSLARAQNVSGWSRARALKVLGDHRFIKEDYKGAAEFYNQAAQADTATTSHKHLHALALAMDNKATQAADIWRAIAANKSDPLSAEAAQLLAQLKLPAPPPAQNPPTVSDATPKPQAQTQQQSVLTVSVTPPAQAADPALLSATKPGSEQVPYTPPPSPSPKLPPSENIFTVQVGAFGAKENADNLAKRLSGEYKDVTVSSTTSGEATLYRVRVGSFKNKDEAAQFADNLVTNSGLSARVVEK